MDIRLLTEADAETYWPLRLRALREHPEAFGSSYEESVDRPLSAVMERLRVTPDNFILGAFDADGSLVGTAGFFREPQLKVRHKGMIVGVYVAPEQRGRGIARALVVAAIVRARTLPDLDQLLLSVVTSNAPARALYRTLGFAPYGLEPCALKVDGTCYDEEHMFLRLADLPAE